MKTIRQLFVFVLMIVITASVVAFSVRASSVILGDADGDGEVCITDATIIQRDVAKITVIKDDFRRSADVDNDGIITIMDATNIQLWLAQISLAYPIGEPIVIPTEERYPASITEPTVDHNNKTVTVDGMDFNISKIPDEVVLDNTTGSSASFMLRNKALPDPGDVHMEVISDNNFTRIDYSDERNKETYLASLDGLAIGSDYLIRDEYDNDIAWVNAHYSNSTYPYQVSICGLSGGSGSFSVAFYYRNTLLKRTVVSVDLSERYGYGDDVKSVVREIESACWESNMTDKEKIKAFTKYVGSHYTYQQLKCTDGALYTAFAARDLGLESMLLYPGGEENQPCPRHLITYNLYYNTTVPGGHCACLVEYDDCIMRYDVQGGACIISDYSD
jgi:hypothetical protein